MRRFIPTRPFYLAALFVLSTALVSADSFTQTYSGSLSDPGSVVQQSITLSSISRLVLSTTSYGGGTNANGTVSTAGGFQPSLTFYNGDGSYFASQQISSPVAQTDPGTGRALDSYLLLPSLPGGSYIVTLTNWATQQPPTATNLRDGFVNYGGSTFADVGGASRTGAYALNVVASADSSAVPEPSSVFLTGSAIGIALLVGVRTRRQRLEQ